MEDGKVRFGILGCAHIARKLSRAMQLTPGVHLYALGSRSFEKAQVFAAANAFPSETKLYGSYEGVLADENVDAVYIPLPTSLHLEWVLKAAEKRKHILLEKPPSLSVEDLEKMISACERNGVQLMDGTMWLHHPRTEKMKDILKNSELFGDLMEVHATMAFRLSPTELKEDIRIKPDLDALGALGDIGWYCAQAALWAADYELPVSVRALSGAKFNEAGVILSCAAEFFWRDGKVATIHFSFLTHASMKLHIFGTEGSLEVDDFVIPFKEDVAHFKLTTGGKFNELHTGWNVDLSDFQVPTSLPQECLMLQKFSGIVREIRDNGGAIDSSWIMITRKIQLLLNAVKSSVENGCSLVLL